MQQPCAAKQLPYECLLDLSTLPRVYWTPCLLDTVSTRYGVCSSPCVLDPASTPRRRGGHGLQADKNTKKDVSRKIFGIRKTHQSSGGWPGWSSSHVVDLLWGSNQQIFKLLRHDTACATAPLSTPDKRVTITGSALPRRLPDLALPQPRGPACRSTRKQTWCTSSAQQQGSEPFSRARTVHQMYITVSDLYRLSHTGRVDVDIAHSRSNLITLQNTHS